MLLRRVLTTFDLVFRFLSKPRVLAIVAFPLILWFLKRLFLGRITFRHDVIALFAVYAVMLVAIFGWQFFKAAASLANEPRLYAEIDKLDIQERNELRRLVQSGKMTIGPPTFDRIAAKTPFIYRDVSGEWRVEKEYRRFLKHWEAESRNK
jgi:hypothetical protein